MALESKNNLHKLGSILELNVEAVYKALGVE